MNFLQAILMGLVQGLTEFLPVSSSGHLVIGRFILNINTDVSALFDALLHVGTLAAVFIVFWSDVRTLIVETILLIRDIILHFSKKKPIEMYAERHFVLLVIIASIPTALIGLLVELLLEDFFLSSLAAVGIMLMITGIILLLIRKIPKGRKRLPQMKYQDALFIGIAQGIAVIPGISRSGSTVTAGLACGLTRDYAFRFSFLCSIPAILGGSVLKLFKITAVDVDNAVNYLFGMIVAGIVGYFALKLLRNLLKKGSYYKFGYYDIAVGAIALIVGMFI